MALLLSPSVEVLTHLPGFEVPYDILFSVYTLPNLLHLIIVRTFGLMLNNKLLSKLNQRLRHFQFLIL